MDCSSVEREYRPLTRTAQGEFIEKSNRLLLTRLVTTCPDNETQQMEKTVYMVNLGCPKNLVDGEVMLGLLAREGYRIHPRS